MVLGLDLLYGLMDTICTVGYIVVAGYLGLCRGKHIRLDLYVWYIMQVQTSVQTERLLACCLD